VRPVSALRKIPLIWSAECQVTAHPPMDELMQRVFEAEQRPGILLVTLSTGFPWADVPKVEVDLPTDEDVAAHIHRLNLDRRDLNASQIAIATVRLGLADPQQGARTDLRQKLPEVVRCQPEISPICPDCL
jgi:microcystin degradation protein MlrC